MKTKMKASCSDKPKHPVNAYIIFQHEFKKRKPMMNKLTSIAKAASKEWYRLGPLGQAPYFAEYKRRMEVYTQSKNINNNSCDNAGYVRKTKMCSRDKPKRPVPVFFLFLRKFKKMHPEMKRVVAITKAAGEEWIALGNAEKDSYIKEYDRQMKDYVEWKNRSVMSPQLVDTPPQVYATPGQISRREGSGEFLQQSNEVARDSAKNTPGFAYAKDKKVVPSQADNNSVDQFQKNNNSVDHATVTDSVTLREQIVELERKLGQSDSEIADLKRRIEELLVQKEELERKLRQQHESDSEVADLKQMIEELLIQNEELKLLSKELIHQKLDHFAEELLDFDEKNAQQHRILGSLDSANKRVPSSLLATPRDAVNEMKKKWEDSHPAVAARQNAGRKESLQIAEMRPSKREAASLMATAASAAHPVAGSSVIRQLQPAASTRKTAHPAAGSSVIRQLQPAASTRKTVHPAAGSSVIRQLQPAASTRKTAHPAAGSSVIRQLQPAASTRKTKGWVY